MASNIVQCLLVATLAVVTMHPRAVFTFSAHLPNSLLLDTPDALEAAADDHQNDQSGEQSNIILLNSNNINSKRMLLDTNSPDDIRCYCNLPACVSNGYMCRTARTHPDGGCFSERLQPSPEGIDPPLPARHGCTNMLMESKETFKCDNNHHTVYKKSGKSLQMTKVMCCHEDMCNHEGTDGKRSSSSSSAAATKNLLQQRVKLNQRDVNATAPSSSSLSGGNGSGHQATAALTKNSSGAAAGGAGASAPLNGVESPYSRHTKYSLRGAPIMDPSFIINDAPSDQQPAEKSDNVDSAYQFADNEQQNSAFNTVTCVVAFAGALGLFTLLYIGIRLLSNDSMGSSPASKLNCSDASGHIMIGAAAAAGSTTSPEGKLLVMESKYFAAAAGGGSPVVHAKNLFANNTGTPSMASTVYQPLSCVQKCSDKLSPLDYQLLAPQLASKLEKGGTSHRDLLMNVGDECATDRLLGVVAARGGSRTVNNNNSASSNNNNTNCLKSSQHINNRAPLNSSANECHCNLAKNCINCSSTNVKFTNDRWSDKDNRNK